MRHSATLSAPACAQPVDRGRGIVVERVEQRSTHARVKPRLGRLGSRSAPDRKSARGIAGSPLCDRRYPLALSVKLLGIHSTPADFAEVPPRIGALSITTTQSPFSWAVTAAVQAPTPLPTTTNVRFAIPVARSLGFRRDRESDAQRRSRGARARRITSRRVKRFSALGHVPSPRDQLTMRCRSAVISASAGCPTSRGPSSPR